MAIIWTILFLLLLVNIPNIRSFSRNSKIQFKRISDGVQSTRCSRCQSESLRSLRNRHRCLYADNRLYFLSLKGKLQPKFGSYHETSLYGGYLSVYGVVDNVTEDGPASNVVSGPSPRSWAHLHFDAIDKTENREDAFFVLNNKLFLLIYTRFENVTYRRLLNWRWEGAPGWVDVPLRVEDRAEFLDGNVQNGAVAWTAEENETGPSALYLTATDGWGKIKVAKMRVEFDGNAVSARIEYVLEDEGSPVNSAGAIVALTYRSDKLYAFYGTQGCGFHWEKRSLIIIDFNASTPLISHVNLTLESGSPPWAFNGPALIEQDGSNWLMFGGSVAVGPTNTEFDHRIWIFNLDTLRWRKSKRARVPAQLNPYETCSAIDPVGGNVYLADFRSIYKAYSDQIYV